VAVDPVKRTESRRRYEESAKARARHRHYNVSAKGRARSRRYEASRLVLAYDHVGRKLRVPKTPEAFGALERITAKREAFMEERKAWRDAFAEETRRLLEEGEPWRARD